MEMYNRIRDLLRESGFSCRNNFGIPYFMIHPLMQTKGVAIKELFLLSIGPGIVLKLLPIPCPYSHTIVDCNISEGISRRGRRLFYRKGEECLVMIDKIPNLMYPEREAIVGLSLTREALITEVTPNLTAVYDILYCPHSYPTHPIYDYTPRSSCSLEELDTEGMIHKGSLLRGYEAHEYSDSTITIAAEKLHYDLHDLLITYTSDMLISSTFQIFWTLWRLRKMYGIFKHNDLGPGNVLVQITDPGTILTYTVGDMVYNIPTYGYIMKIWDFDKVDLPLQWWREKKEEYPWLVIYPSIGTTPPDEIQYSEKVLELLPDLDNEATNILRMLIDAYVDTDNVMEDADVLFDIFLSTIGRRWS